MSIALSGEHYGVMGEKRYLYGTVTLTDQASGAVQIPGIGVVEHASVTPGTVWGGATYAIALNEASGGTALNGSLRIKSAASADAYSVFVIGR